VNVAGFAGGGASTVTPGGAANGGSSGSTGSAVAGSNPGGANQGGNGGTSGTTAPSSCPAFVGSGGVLITPPSDSYETSIEGWSKLSGLSGMTRVEGDGTACDGVAYLAANGALRQGGWDGPSVTLVNYLTVGHSYVMAIAARLNNGTGTAPIAGRAIGLTMITVCDGGSPVYTQLRRAVTTTSWLRLQTEVLTIPPAGCKSLTHIAVYVETDDADKAMSIELDDFRLYDKTNPSSLGGAAGAAGASSLTEVAGGAGAPGVTSAGSAGTSSANTTAGNAGTAGRSI
jgi:hypothetical protein